MTSSESPTLFGLVDIELETAGLLAHYEPFIASERALLPKLSFYEQGELILSINSRNFDDSVVDRDNAIREMLLLLVPVRPEVCLLSFVDSVELTTGISPGIITIAINQGTALTRVFPWRIENDAVVYDHDAQINPDTVDVYSPYVQRMLQVLTRVYSVNGQPLDTITYLDHMGHDIAMYGDWSLDNFNIKCLY